MPVKFTGLQWASVLEEVKHGCCPQDEDPRCGCTAKSQRNTIEGLCSDKGDSVSCFCQLLQTLSWAARFNEPSSAWVLPLTSPSGAALRASRQIPVDLQTFSSYRGHCSYAMALTPFWHFNFALSILAEKREQTLILRPKATKIDKNISK